MAKLPPVTLTVGADTTELRVVVEELAAAFKRIDDRLASEDEPGDAPKVFVDVPDHIDTPDRMLAFSTGVHAAEAALKASGRLKTHGC